MTEARTGLPSVDAQDPHEGGATPWKGRTFWYDRGMPKLPPLPSDKEARRSRRRRRLLATTCLIILLVPVVVVTTSYHGTLYTYRYSLTVENVGGPFLIIIPAILIAEGKPFPHLDIEELLPGDCRLNATEHGIGLEVMGDRNLTLALKAEYNACVHSRDHTSDGNPVLSMSTLSSTADYGIGFKETAWLRSNVSGLKVKVYFTRVGDNWYGSGLGGWEERGGTFTDFWMSGVSKIGWTSVDLLVGHKTID